ncbi:MAG: hypothetical protein QXM27_02825 [Candidatus Pacearchaeota archaeon]
MVFKKIGGKKYIPVLIEGDGLFGYGIVYFIPANSEVGKTLIRDEYPPPPDIDPEGYFDFLKKIREEAKKSIEIDYVFYATI